LVRNGTISNQAQFPSIVKAAIEISYDNGGINRFRTEEMMLDDLEVFLNTKDQFVLSMVNRDLKSLTEEELHIACCGEETEMKELYLLAVTYELLNEIFNEVG
jgi:hypothetical protein